MPNRRNRAAPARSARSRPAGRAGLRRSWASPPNLRAGPCGRRPARQFRL